MTAILLPNGKQAFTYPTGLPLVGGKVFTYASGTSTPQTTWVDAGQITPNANPVILDSRGEAIIFWNGAYKVTLKDALDNVIWTVDGIQGYPQDITVRSDLAASNGSSLVGFIQAGAGAVARTSLAKMREVFSVKDFGAAGDGVTNDTAAINAAILAASAAPGGSVFIPKGNYIVGALTMKPFVKIFGEGNRASVLTSSHVGDGLAIASPINSSTAVGTSVSDIGMTNTNGANTGGGYVDVGGTFVNLFNVRFLGFKYQVIFDQTELATIRQCDFEAPLRAGVWLVCNNEHTVGAAGEFTNRINIEECQFNGSGTVYGVLDDGGYVHTIRNNNFNGCLNHIKVAATNNLEIACNEFESAAGACITLSANTAAGNAVGSPVNTKIDTNAIIPTAAQSCVSITNSSTLVVINNSLGNSAAAKITGLVNCSKADLLGNTVLGGPYLSGTATIQVRDDDTGSFTPVLTFGGAAVGITYSVQSGTYVRFGSIIQFTLNITLTSKGSSVGQATITGLPYTIPFTQAVPVAFAAPVNTVTSIGAILAGGGSATIVLQNAAVNYSAGMNDTHFTNTTALYITGVLAVQ